MAHSYGFWISMAVTSFHVLYEPKHRCFIPNCDGETADTIISFNASYCNFALPTSYNSTELFKRDEEFDPCLMYNGLNDENTCSKESFNAMDRIKCQSYVYDQSIFEETLTSQLNLASYFFHFVFVC